MTSAQSNTNGFAQSNDRKTVLVVEDELFIRINIADYHRDCGFHVVEAATGDDAKAVIESGRTIHVVFSDVQMPGKLDGFGLARWIRQHRPDIHVILNSGMANAAEKAGDLCEDGPLMAKPYDEAQVMARIQQMLRAANQREL
ncbi:response regulator [Aliihoeflea sp. 40Bstr573]|uniref:response regulator n=1 Tax=Aliihoeflea sp. 40Bstr573 TaxID=2696467 RepID=UPI003379EAA4|nr:response regulator [Aliihoeflea sp. 40Bstr573]